MHPQTTQAGAFLVWLTACDIAVSACTQADLDAWHAEKYSTRRPAQAFLRWCMDSRRMPRLSIPNRPTSNPHPMGQHQRVAALQRVLADGSTSPQGIGRGCTRPFSRQPQCGRPATRGSHGAGPVHFTPEHGMPPS